MGLRIHAREPKTDLFGITKDRVRREYSHIQEQLRWWTELPRHSGLEFSGSMLQAFWTRTEFGKGEVVAHTPFSLLRDAITRVLEETATTCRHNGLRPETYIEEAAYLLRGLIHSVYDDMVHLEAEARRMKEERDAQPRHLAASSAQPERLRDVYAIAQGLKQGIRQFDIEDSIRTLDDFLVEQAKAHSLLARSEEKAERATGTNSQATEWDVFISHASEDKEAFVRLLAEALQKEKVRVWYDEFTLTVGDSLRRSIDRGLAGSRYGIVVISPDFLRKEWPQKELDGLFALEVDGRKVILPVWHNIDAEILRRSSPLLADRYATCSTKGIDGVVKDLTMAMK